MVGSVAEVELRINVGVSFVITTFDVKGLKVVMFPETIKFPSVTRLPVTEP